MNLPLWFLPESRLSLEREWIAKDRRNHKTMNGP